MSWHRLYRLPTAMSLLLLVLGVSSAAAAGPVEDYDGLTFTVLGDLLWLATQPPAVPAPQPAAADAGRLRTLNDAMVRLMNELPPPERMRQHLLLLPALQEAASALMAVHEAAGSDDAARLEVAREWLHDSLGRTREVIHALSQNAP